MKLEKREEYLAVVSDAIREAENRHPDFAAEISQRRLRPGSIQSYKQELADELERVRKGNECREKTRHSDIENLIREELLAAIAAVYSQDFRLAMKKFSRVAAIAVRAMDWAHRQSVEHRIADKFRKAFRGEK